MAARRAGVSNSGARLQSVVRDFGVAAVNQVLNTSLALVDFLLLVFVVRLFQLQVIGAEKFADDGKSTLIGRLLIDTGALPEGKLDAVKAMARRRGMPVPETSGQGEWLEANAAAIRAAGQGAA